MSWGLFWKTDPGKILEDIWTLVANLLAHPEKILLNLIESYWFIIFKRDTDPTPPRKILLNLRRHLYNCNMPRQNLIESYWFIIVKRDTDPTPPQKILLNPRQNLIESC